MLLLCSWSKGYGRTWRRHVSHVLLVPCQLNASSTPPQNNQWIATEGGAVRNARIEAS